MFVSMWISNTAAVAMMIPIMQAVLEELEAVEYLVPFPFRTQTLKYMFLFTARTMQNVLG